MTWIDSRLGLAAALTITALVVSCDELPETHLKDTAGSGGQSAGTAGKGGTAGGKAGSGGTGTSGSSGKGTAGSSAAGGDMGGTGGGGGSAGSGNTGNGGTVARGGTGGGGGTTTDAGNGGEAPGGATNGGETSAGGRTFSTNRDDFFGDSRCATAGVVLCEDFEADSLDTDRWTPRGAAPDIDDALAARGAHSAHFHTVDNGLQYISQTETFPAPNNTYYVRMFVWFDSMPTEPDWAHWTVSGAVGDGNDSEIRVGGQFDPNEGKNLFGVGTDGGPTGDWTNLDGDDGSQPVPEQSWVCLEWMHKGDTNETKFWWDGVEHPSLHTTESMHGGSDDPYTLPEFNEMWVGWWLYQEGTNPPEFDVWIDEVAIDYARIGCDI